MVADGLSGYPARAFPMQPACNTVISPRFKYAFRRFFAFDPRQRIDFARIATIPGLSGYLSSVGKRKRNADRKRGDMVRKKSALVPSDATEMEDFARLVMDSRAVVEASRHGEPDREFLVTTAKVSFPENGTGIPRLYARMVVWAQDEEEAIHKARAKALTGKKGKIGQDDAGFFSCLLAMQGQGYAAQAGAVSAQEQAPDVPESAESIALREHLDDLRARYEHWRREGDKMLAASIKAELAENGVRV